MADEKQRERQKLGPNPERFKIKKKDWKESPEEALQKKPKEG